MKGSNINTRHTYLKWLLLTVLLLAGMLASSLLSLCVGERTYGLLELLDVFTGGGTATDRDIIVLIRFPRILLALSVGGSLSLAGAILQGIYRNPLVEPYTLGVSGGAALGVTLVIILGLNHWVGGFMLPLAGFAGSLLAIAVVYVLSSRGGKIHIRSMLLIGVMISFIVSALMMFLMAVTSTRNLHGIVFWMMGSLDQGNAGLIYTSCACAIAALMLSCLFSGSLNALRLGETKARHLGINTEMTLRILFVVASLLAGMSVSVAGVIGFVGLVVPHLARLAVGTDHRILLVSSFLGGGIFLVLSDLVARTVIRPNELPIGVITGIIGGTVFVVVLAGSRRKVL